MTTTSLTPAPLVFRRGAVPLVQELVAVDEDLLAEQRALHTADLAAPRVDGLTVAALRNAWEVAEPADPTAFHRDADGVDVRVLAHPSPRAVVLHAYPGGFVACHNAICDQWLGLLRDAAHVTVVSAGYRRAPEHPYPAAVDDLETVAAWIAGAGMRAQRLVFVGESAGAVLLAATLLRLRERRPDVLAAVAGAALTYGSYDMTGSLPAMRNSGSGTPVVSGALLEWVARRYAASAELTHPEISPLYADLHGLPPALFTVGESDPMVDDSILMANRWALAGNPARLTIYPEAVHVFDEFGTRLADLARRRTAGWVAATANPDENGRATGSNP
jgi:acetyl esterase/lipase